MFVYNTQEKSDSALQGSCVKLAVHSHTLSAVGHPRGLVRAHVEIDERLLTGFETVDCLLDSEPRGHTIPAHIGSVVNIRCPSTKKL